jgi:hypothetical protein
MTWQPGRDRVERLLDAGELEGVSPDDALARRLISNASKHLVTAVSALNADDLAGAYQLAYDALRKSAAALLAIQGLSPDSSTRGPTADDVRDAISVGTQARDAAVTILDQSLLGPWNP